jgi:hypothetical protein
MIEIMGEINIHSKFNTVGDIRKFLEKLDEYRIKDDAALLDGYATVCFRGDVEPIECGEHFPSEDRVMDFLVLSHNHDADDMFEPLGYSEGKFEGK